MKPAYLNPCAEEARADSSERRYWYEAAFRAQELVKLSQIAAAYHLGAAYPGVLPQPVGWALMQAAISFANAEQCALSIRKHRAEEKQRAKAKKKR